MINAELMIMVDLSYNMPPMEYRECSYRRRNVLALGAVFFNNQRM